MVQEKKYNVEEFHRNKWQPLMKDNGEQKFVRITEEQADINNSQTPYSKLRYVLEEDKPAKKTTKKTVIVDETDTKDVSDLIEKATKK